MESLRQDIRFAFRTLVKNPGFAAVAVLSLALGVGLNTTIFTLLNAVLLVPLPVDRPSELIAVYTTDQAASPGITNGLLKTSYLNLKDFRERQDVLVDMAGYSTVIGVSISTGDEPQQAFAELVTGNYFRVLGVRSALGRLLTPEEDTAPGADPVVVLSHGFWQRVLGSDPSVVGRTISLNGAPFTVAGVTPKGFYGVNSVLSPDVWVPSMMYAHVLPSQTRTWMNERRGLLFFVAGRLKAGTSAGKAEANLKTIAGALETEYPAPNKGRSITVRPLSQATIFPGLRPVFVLGGAVLMTTVGLVLLIACSNVANLMMARAAARRQEIAVRVALGASRRRLVQQLLTESLLLASMAGAVGLLFAVAGRDAIWSIRPPFIADNIVDLTLDRRVLAFTAAVSMLTGVLFGLIPALQASRPDVVSTLKDEGRSAGPSRRRLRFSHILVVGQVALSVVTLIVAGLVIRSLQGANQIDPRYDVDQLAIVTVGPGQSGYAGARLEQFYRTAHQRVTAVPGVESATWTSQAPLGAALFRTIVREGADPEAKTERHLVVVTTTSPGYFATLGIPLLNGRDFTEADRGGSVPVAIVNQPLADRLWPGEEVIGKRFRFFTDSFQHQIVGVARTIEYNKIGEAPEPAAYIPFGQNPSDTMSLMVRSRDPAAALGSTLRELRALDPHVPRSNVFVMRDLRAQALWPAISSALVLSVVGALVLVLASIGLYGMMAYAVAQRTREIGVRMALGANRSHVLRMVVRQAMSLVAIGLVIGGAGALAISRVMTGLLFGVSPTDPVTFGAVALVLVLVALTASYVPASRASRLDPLNALR